MKISRAICPISFAHSLRNRVTYAPVASACCPCPTIRSWRGVESLLANDDFGPSATGTVATVGAVGYRFGGVPGLAAGTLGGVGAYWGIDFAFNRADAALARAPRADAAVPTERHTDQARASRLQRSEVHAQTRHHARPARRPATGAVAGTAHRPAAGPGPPAGGGGPGAAAHHRRHRFEMAGVQRQFLSMPWRGPSAEGDEREYFIWGATAAILFNLRQRLEQLG